MNPRSYSKVTLPTLVGFGDFEARLPNHDPFLKNMHTNTSLSRHPLLDVS